MKNTLLNTGIALAIALFVSVQISAMVPGTPHKNPYLNQYDSRLLEIIINSEEGLIKTYIQQGRSNDPQAKRAKERLREVESIYYGNRPYSEDEISGVLH